MRKVAGETMSDVYAKAINSPIKDEISGGIYRSKRPTDSQLEDIVVIYKTGIDDRVMDGNTQSGAITLNLWVPFVDNGSGVKIANERRITELEKILLREILTWNDGEYLFRVANVIMHFDEIELEQSFITVDLQYERYT